MKSGYRIVVRANGEPAIDDTTARRILASRFRNIDTAHRNVGFDVKPKGGLTPKTVAGVVRTLPAFADCQVRQSARKVWIKPPADLQEAHAAMLADWQLMAAQNVSHGAMRQITLNHPLYADRWRP